MIEYRKKYWYLITEKEFLSSHRPYRGWQRHIQGMVVSYRGWQGRTGDNRGLQFHTGMWTVAYRGLQVVQGMCTGSGRGCKEDDRENRDWKGIFIRRGVFRASSVNYIPLKQSGPFHFNKLESVLANNALCQD